MNYASKRRVLVVAAGVLLAATAFAARHWQHLTTGGVSDTELVFLFAFTWLIFISVVPYFHRDVKRTYEASLFLGTVKVHVTVPAHNEDHGMALAMLDSLLVQTKQPSRVHIVENGGAGYTPDLKQHVDRWVLANKPGFDVVYEFNNKPSKRKAQALAWFRTTSRQRPDQSAYDIYMTLDSDVILDKHAIERGTLPFIDPEVMSVGGLLFGQNYKKSLLTRIIEVGFISSFLNGRAAFSMVNSVTVQSGGLAFYRSTVVHKYLKHYLSHRVAGREMPYGDDAMMSRYALMEGKNLFQGGCQGYTLHPEKFKHLTNQRIRWWRSFFWGNIWFLGAFPATRIAWWLVARHLVNFCWYTVLVPYVLIYGSVHTGSVQWEMFPWVVVISMFASARGLTVPRDNQGWKDITISFLVSPLVGVLNLYLGFVLQYVGLFTCLKTGWSTRKKKEVGLATA